MRPEAMLIFALTLVLSTPPRVAPAQDLEIHGYVYDHPLTKSFTSRDGRTFPIEIDRKVVFEIRLPDDSPADTVAIRATVLEGPAGRGHDLGRARVPVDGPVLEVAFEAPGDLQRATEAVAEIEVDDGEGIRRRVPFHFHRVHGRVTDFSGDPPPVASFVVLEADQNEFVAGVETDSLGRYEMLVPAREYHTAIALNENFGDTTLERWAHHLTVEGDTRIDFRIGEVEVYRLTAAVTAESTVIADFSLFTIHHFLDPMIDRLEREGEETSMLEIVADRGFYPDLGVADVALAIDGRPVEVWTVERRGSSLKAYGGTEQTRPYWIVEGPLPDGIEKGRHRLEVVVTIESDSDGRTIVERGEASFHDLEVW